MAGRNLIFADGQYYHIFNRGIARQPVFFTKRDYERFILTFNYYRYINPPLKLSRFLQTSLVKRIKLMESLNNSSQLIDILCFVLMPNHFHYLLKQNIVNGISIFMSKTINSYTKYINTKQERVGDLFQGVFKAVHIESDEQLIHVSRYIHLNPVTSHLVSSAKISSYCWSSYRDYLKGKSKSLQMDPVLSLFKSNREFEQFVLDQADFQQKLDEISHLTLEDKLK